MLEDKSTQTTVRTYIVIHNDAENFVDGKAMRRDCTKLCMGVRHHGSTPQVTDGILWTCNEEEWYGELVITGKTGSDTSEGRQKIENKIPEKSWYMLVEHYHAVGADQATEDKELWKHVIADVVFEDKAP